MKKRPFLPWLVGVLLAAVTAPAAVRGEEKHYPTEFIPVQNLTRPIEDAKVSTYSLDPIREVREMLRWAGASRLRIAEEKERRFLSEDELRSILVSSIPFWRKPRDDYASFSINNGKIRVTAPPAVVESMRAIVKAMEKEACRTVTVSALLFRAPEEFRPGTGVRKGDSHVLAAAPCNALLKVLATRRDLLLEQASTMGLNGQKVFLSRGRERKYLRDFERGEDGEKPTPDPNTDVLRDGLVVEARTFFGVDATVLRLDYSVNCSRYEAGAFDTGVPGLGSLDTPRLRFWRTGGSAVVPSGGGVLFGPLPAGLAKALLPAEDGGEKKAEGKERKAKPPEVYLLLRLFESGGARKDGRGK